MPAQSVVFSIYATPDLIPEGDLGPLCEFLGEDFSPILDLMGLDMAQWQQRNFEDKGQTFGVPWAAVTPKTQREKDRLGFGDETLVRTGRLASEVGETILLTANSVTTGINLDFAPYAAVHDNPSSDSWVPQRILVALVPAEIDQLQKRLIDYIVMRTGIAPSGIEVRASEITPS
ncbi:MAG TPA: phage virion morphogenesis protein [Bryobacteraceae bacterium]|nr:phage virion morphogenesis protein [Bryobacteraceae bacterium]